MANHFAQRGDRVTVITVKSTAYQAYDRSRLAAVDRRVDIVRVGSRDPARLAGLLPFYRHIRKWWRKAPSALRAAVFPDSRVGFVGPAASKIRALLNDARDTVLITTSPPVSAHQVGLLLRRRRGLYWVADWRDIWLSLPYFPEPEKYRRRALSLQKAVAAAADLVSATSPETLHFFRRRVNDQGRYLFLPNGYQEDDFVAAPPAERVSVGLYGTLNHLIGMETFLRWLGAFRNAHPESPFELRHVGYVDMENLSSLLTDNGLRSLFTSTGYLPHYDGIQQIRANRLNVISLSADYDTSYIIPSRLFDLLRAEPPVIALLPPQNAARKLLERHAFADVFTVDRERDFQSVLLSLLCRPPRGESPRKRPGVEVYDRARQMAELSSKLDSLLDR
jgi:hypothetical protein